MANNGEEIRLKREMEKLKIGLVSWLMSGQPAGAMRVCVAQPEDRETGALRLQ